MRSIPSGEMDERDKHAGIADAVVLVENINAEIPTSARTAAAWRLAIIDIRKPANICSVLWAIS
ncbi:MAG: hypothetical protein ACO1Q7_10625 [Gemmatimonas sp.]